jgi:hypothetical protein
VDTCGAGGGGSGENACRSRLQSREFGLWRGLRGKNRRLAVSGRSRNGKVESSYCDAAEAGREVCGDDTRPGDRARRTPDVGRGRLSVPRCSSSTLSRPTFSRLGLALIGRLCCDDSTASAGNFRNSCVCGFCSAR